MELLINNGKSDYAIFIGAEPAEPIEWAAVELQRFLELSSGVKLEIARARDVGKKYIFLGIVPSGCEDAVNSLNASGFCIKSGADGVYVFSKMPAGSMYGAYELLKRLIGWESYACDELDYEKKSVIELPDFDITENPSIEYRVVGFDNVDDKTNSRRMRKMWITESDDVDRQSLPDDEWYNSYFSSLFCHTTFMLLPPERDENGELVHPDWYNKEVNQLCWTNEEACDALIEKLKAWILKWKNGKMFLIGEEDNSSYCTCEKCSKLYEKYGFAGVHVRFINRIAEKIEAWRKETMPERDFMLGCFAYLRVKNPPVVLNEQTGEYEPVDESVRLNDKVAVFNAIIDACGYHSLECGCNHDIKVRFDKWKAISKQMLVWDYHACFDNFFVNIHDFRNYADYIRRYVAYNAKMIFAEGNGWSHMPGFADFKAWLYCKLAWNCNADTDSLLDEFFAAYYREAAPAMKEFLGALEEHYKRLEVEYAKLGPRGFHMSYDTLGYPDALTERHWPREALDRLWAILDRADVQAAAIADDELRAKVLRRIKTERCAIEYLYIEIHTYYADEGEFNGRIERFKADCAECNLKRLTDWPKGKTIDDCVGKWLCRYPARDRAAESLGK